MKKLLAVLLLLILGTSCFAKGLGPQDIGPAFGREYVPPHTHSQLHDPCDHKCLSEKAVRDIAREAAQNIYKKPILSKGLAVGFHGAVPTIVYNGGWYDAEIGYSSIDSDPQGLVKVGLNWASLKTGLTWIQDNGSRIGWYVGKEYYIDKSISLTGDIYLLTSGENRTDILTAVIGGRLYLD